ncbi:MAG: penicillin-binding protein activator, partial [Halioglobus sp.]|nr:penicillin-binding protein activator [Halioglobus sp.]
GLAYRIVSFLHYMLGLGGDTLESACLAAQILKSSPGPRGSAWKQRAWRDLQRASSEQLALALETAMDPEWIAWLQLAQDARGNPNTLSAVLADWLALHPEHPAANPLPGGLEYARQLQPPGQVALLLPLSGRLAPAGEAVLNGYLAAHYAARQPGGSRIDLRVLDIASFPSATAAYDAAVQGGAGLVVGPLDKSAVAELAVRADRRVPVLALNRIDTPTVPAASALVQLSLSPEDEAVTVAELAYGRGGRSALIISPAGPRGAEVENALRTRWSALGGRVASTVNYSGRDDLSDSVKSALGLSASEQRARTLGDYLAMDLEFTPRRREDADVIFLLSRNGAEARSIKPLLAFHYAGELPVYALSTVYGGAPNDRNRDLDGIHLVEMPWLLGESAELRVALAAADYGGGNTTRLNALGADAHLVGSGFARLQSGAEALFRGHTGLLDMDPGLRIRRELSPATFDGGDLRRE